MNTKINQSPHQGQPVLHAGAPLDRALAAMIMIHGRGATAASILSLTAEFDHHTFAYLAPQAAGGTWYPDRFLAPIQNNEPWLTSALHAVDETVARLTGAGIPHDRIMLLGFSQGACLALEYAARHPRRYGGVVGLSGGLIGPDGMVRNLTGSFAGTPVFLGCSDVDFHIPKERVFHAAGVFKQLAAEVTVRLYPNMEHTINEDEIKFVTTMMSTMTISPRVENSHDRR